MNTMPASLRILAACAVVLIGSSVHAGDTWFVRGYFKSLALVQEAVEISGAPPGLAPDRIFESQNALRLMVDWFPREQIACEFHYEIEPLLYSSASVASPAGGGVFATPRNDYRYSDIAQRLDEGDGRHLVLQNLDRLNVRVALERGDLTIGRQAVALGAARVINPTDLFLPFDVRALNQEYRIGIDALRYQRQMGDLSELDAALILGADGRHENNAFYMQATGNVAGQDLSAIYARFAERNLFGFGVQGALGEAGFWFEGAYVSGASGYVRISAGLDYALSERWFAMVEYHFSGAGAGSPENYAALAGDIAYRRGGVFLLGRHYLIPSLNWTVSPLCALSLQALANLDDHSMFAALSAQYSLADDLYLNVGYYHFRGAGIRFRPVESPPISLGSEYGGNPDVAFTSLRYYF